MLQFRPLTPEDKPWALPEMIALMQHSGPWLRFQGEAFYERFFGPQGDALAAIDDEGLAGFSLVARGELINPHWRPVMARFGDATDAWGICCHRLVAPRHRGQGVGGRLLGLAMGHARRAGLRHLLGSTDPDNLPSLTSFLSAGFNVLETRPFYDRQVTRTLLHRPIAPPRLDHPRLALCHLPTPIEPLHGLTARFGGPRLFIKRDDAVGLATGGNKSRMLEYLLGGVSRGDSRTLLTRGHALSNHCRQTAAAAARLGLRCHLVLKGEPTQGDRGNAYLGRLLGAEITWTRGRDPEALLQEVHQRLNDEGRAPLLIKYGGAGALGVAAYAEAVREIIDAGERFDRIYVATSSGATQAGLVAGTSLFGLSTKVMGISIDEPAPPTRARVAALASEVGRCYGLGLLPICASQVHVDDGFLGGGYGVVGHPEREAIELFARDEGLLLDPVYTGRAAAGMFAHLRSGLIGPKERVLFLHTGGIPGLFGLGEDLRRLMS